MSQKKIKISTNDVSVTPNGKKLVQARLPFKTLASTPKAGVDSLVTGESRKRRLSTTEDDNRSLKLSKTSGAKENIKKSDEVTVLAMVDLVNDDDDDIAMTENDIPPAVELVKPTKKSTKGMDAEEKDVPLRRSHRKTDSDVPPKVVIKIPSAKKKKSHERQSKPTVVPKIDENDDDDDDVIPLDSEENSRSSFDGKEKSVDDKADSSIVLLDDESFASDGVTDTKVADAKVADAKVADSTVADAKVADSTVADSTIEVSAVAVDPSEEHVTDPTTLPVEKCSNETAESRDVVVAMETSGERDSPVGGDTNTVDAIVDTVETIDSSSCDNTDSESSNETDSKAENLLASTNEPEISSSKSVVDSNGERIRTDKNVDQNTVSTPASNVKRHTRQSTDNSAMSTPKTPAPKTSSNSALTPKQLQKKLESEQKRLAKEKAKEERERKIQEAKEDRERKIQEAKEERERKIQEAKDERERKIQEAKEERERKVQEEKELRQRERDEKERQKKKERDDKEELKRKEREDKEEQRRKEKEERDRKKQAEIDAKNEEKRQKEEEKVAKEEAELKKKRKEAEAFTKFFAKKSSKSAENDKMDVDEVEVKLNFMPFRVKPDMRLAPIVRRKLSPTRKSKFDGEVLNSTDKSPSTDLYIHSLRNGSHVSERQGKTWPSEENNDSDDDDLMIVDDLDGGTPIEEMSAVQKYRAKFFKFEENRRPPYYGTWQKKSSLIKPRRPFVTDQKFFDYEVDSDDEWEDEEPGESLHGSDDEKDKESDDDYDIDNEFFVPHGHLSDEELANNDEIDDDNSPDTQKAKLKIMQKVFSDEMKKKTEKIKPRLIGLIWQNKDGSQPLVCPKVIWEMLQVRSMIFNGPAIVMPVEQSADKNDAIDENGESKKSSAVKKRPKLTEEDVADLLRLIHGNTNSGDFLAKEFRAFTAEKNKGNDKFQEFSLASIRLKIKELAEWKPCPEDGPSLNKYCWYVSSEQRKHYNMEHLSIINDWTYTLTPKTKTKTEPKKVLKESDKGKNQPNATDESAKTPKSKLGNIEKFTKILSDDEKKRNFSIPVQESPLEMPTTPKPKPSDAEPSPKPAKKRVKLLMSVPRGQEIPVQTKNSLISQYLSGANANKKSADTDEPICID